MHYAYGLLSCCLCGARRRTYAPSLDVAQDVTIGRHGSGRDLLKMVSFQLLTGRAAALVKR